jgi:hypothetical protein
METKNSIKEGAIKSICIGKSVIYHLEDIEAALKNAREQNINIGE